MSRNHNSVTEETLRFSFILYTTFSLGYFHLSLLFFIFNDVDSAIDSILFPAMAESNLLIKGEELEVKNEFPATGKKKQQGKTSFW